MNYQVSVTSEDGQEHVMKNTLDEKAIAELAVDLAHNMHGLTEKATAEAMQMNRDFIAGKPVKLMKVTYRFTPV